MGLDVLYLLIPASLVLAVAALLLFVWAIQSGQFDDLETPALRILFDDAPPPSEPLAAARAAAPTADHPPVKRPA
jgi:cbb3-type cytochrome oxidase maturation protein